ncbi:ATP-dependent DNA helicase, partial [Phenoliferia sp. Uapishka_3]
MSHSSQADSSLPELDAMSTLPSSAGPATPAVDDEATSADSPSVTMDFERVAKRDPSQSAEQSERLSKLTLLLQKSGVYSKILASSMADERKKAEEATKRAKDRKEAKLAKEAVGKPVVVTGSRARASPEKPSPKGAKGTKAKKRKADAGPEGFDEPEEKKAKVVIDEAEWEAPVMEVQSKLVTGATLRDYQLAGAQWLGKVCTQCPFAARALTVASFAGGQIRFRKMASAVSSESAPSPSSVLGCTLNSLFLLCPSSEMGLGKTLQTIAFIAWLWENQVYGPFIIVVPLSVLDNWISEFRRFTPSLPLLRYYGPDRALLRKDIYMDANGRATIDTPIILTTYQIVMNDRAFLSKFTYKWLVVDEAHRLKNMDSRLIRELKMFTSEHRLLLTGTPLQNNLVELFSLLSFVLPEIFTDVDLFKNLFDFESANGLGADTAAKAGFIASQLHEILKPFMLRRLKKDVETSLPMKKEYVLYAPMTAEQKKLSDHVLNGKIRDLLIAKETAAPGEVVAVPEPVVQVIEEGTISARIAGKKGGRKSVRRDYSEIVDDEAYFAAVENGDDGMDAATAAEVGLAHAKRIATTRVNNMYDLPQTLFANAVADLDPNRTLQNACMQLRKSALHPFLFDAEMEWDVDDKRLLESSGKMLLLNRLLGGLFEGGHKVLIFSQFTKMLDIIHDWAYDQKKWDLCRIDGNTKIDERRTLMEKFNAPDGTCKLFLLSTRAGGVGINLVAADTVIFFDSDWNPQQDLQAMDRAHRIGQTKPVLVFRLVTENSIEGKILERAGSKRKLEKLVIGNGKFNGNYSDVNDLFSGTKRKDRTALEVEFAEQLANDGEQVYLAEAGDDILSDEQLAVLLDRSEETMNSKSSWKGDGKTANFAVVETEALGDEADELAGLFEVEEEKVASEEEDDSIIPDSAVP